MSDDEFVSVRIRGQEWAYWDDIEITRSIDTHSTVGFTAPFEVERKEFRDTFRPFSFAPLEVLVNGKHLFTGKMIDVQPQLKADERTVQISAYSKAAVLEDCNIPADSVPFEATGLSLRQIAERLGAPFGVGVVLAVPDPSAFKKVNTKTRTLDTKLESDQKIQDFLADLARQRGLVIADTERGELLFQKSIAPGNPVVRLEEGQAPLLSVAPTLNPQEYFTEVTGFRLAKRGSVGSKYTLASRERIAGGVLRSLSFRLDDIEKADVPTAVRAHVGRMLASAVSYVITVPTWRDPSGELWAPNTTLVLKAPSAFVFKDYEFLIRDVVFHCSSDERTASLGLVLPGVFSGDLPPTRPWDE
jgi:prophage tail gpP-like protein